MGNAICDVKTAAPEGAGTVFLSAKEAERLQQVYKRIFASTASDAPPTVDESELAKVFEISKKPHILQKLANSLASRVTNYAEFEEFVVSVTRKSPRDTLRMFWEMVGPSETTSASTLWTLIIEAAIWDDPEPCYGSLRFVNRAEEFMRTASLLCGLPADDATGRVNFEALNSFMNNYMPHATKALETFFSMACFHGTLSPSYRPFHSPRLDVPSEIATACDLLPLALYSDALQGQWKRLYSTSVDGLSFNRVVYHCLGYDGPTCVLIRCADEDSTVIGALTFDRWKDSNRFYGKGCFESLGLYCTLLRATLQSKKAFIDFTGSSKNALFSLSPKLRIYRSKGTINGSYQWLNTKSPTLPRGLGFGGTTEGFRLFIPETLEHCTVADSCPTYETGKLIDGESFEIHTLEVWGGGGSNVVASALLAQSRERAQVDENIRKARQVDKAQFFNNEFDREFFLSGTTSQGGNNRLGNS
jgi:hypothetical protein